MALSGHRRVALHMSAFGGKRTSSCTACRFLTQADSRRRLVLAATMLVLSAGGRHADGASSSQLLGGAAERGRSAARAQQSERVRRIGVLMAVPADDADYQAPRSPRSCRALQQLGWTRRPQRANRHPLGRDATLDDIRKHAAELVALAPDVILAGLARATVAPLLQATRTVPIVFAVVIDPVGAGFVDSLARPGGTPPALRLFEYGLSGKWLELLKQIAPGVTRVAVASGSRHIAAGIGQFAAIQSVAPSLGVELTPIDVRDPGEIERAVDGFARSSNGGLIVTASALARAHRDLIIALAARLQTACCLLRSLLRRRWRLDLLWT